jgi:glyoxylase-like metal-dependent hydrolase (beta-lactamase superfamily II)
MQWEMWRDEKTLSESLTSNTEDRVDCRLEVKSMSVSIHPKIEQVSTQFNGTKVELYVIRGDRNIIIDTGTTQSPERDLLPRLRILGLNLSHISLILNTHGHFDHTAGNKAVKTAGGAQISIHKEDVLFLRDREYCFENYFAPVVKMMGGDLQTEKKVFLEMLGPEVIPDQELCDGDVIDAGKGIQLQAIHLPGHTLGSTGFFWEKEGILFAGDSLVGLHVEGGKLPVIFDLAAYMKSLQRLKQIPVRFLLASHHYRGTHLPPNPIRQESEVSQYLGECQEFAERLDAAVRKSLPYASERRFMEVADEVIVDLPIEMGFAPITQVQRPLYSTQTIFFAFYNLGQYRTVKSL